MYLIITIIPTIIAIFISITASKIGASISSKFATISVLISSVLSYFAYYEIIINENIVKVSVGSWINIGIISTDWSIIFDNLSVSMLVVVLTVSTIVHIYSIDYISSDPHNSRFFSYLSIFTGAILVLVSADNYILIFVGWEGIGVASYLLIGFWYTRIEATKSAFKALIINRIGDLIYTIGAISLYCIVGNFDVSTIDAIMPYLNEHNVEIVGIFFIIAAIGKSAQFGLHTWLPDAINGPTPVSALIHAATLVTAGIYLLIRSSNILEYSNTLQIIIIFIGTTTAFFAASTGIVQSDIKTVIAYSTCSQLGYIFICIGISQYNVALFHLINHAFFKAILFIAAGSIIHATIDQQDTRKIGGLLAFMPFTYSAILTASLSLIALPFITGFYSKDLILEIAIGQWKANTTYAYILGTITASITAFYSVKLMSINFITTPINNSKIYNNIHESKAVVIVPIIVLFIFALFWGYIISDIYVGIGSATITPILILPNNITHIEAEFSLTTITKIIPLFITLFGGIIAYIIYHNYYKNYIKYFISSKGLKVVYKYFYNKWNIDTIINQYVLNSVNNLGYFISTIIDKYILDNIIGPYGMTKIITKTSQIFTIIDTNNLTEYILLIGLTIVILPTISLMFTTLDVQINYMIFVIVIIISIIKLFKSPALYPLYSAFSLINILSISCPCERCSS